MNTILYRGYATVLSVEERFHVIRGRRNADGGVDFERGSLGWFIRLTESSAIRVGTEKPDVNIGDTIISLEKV